VLGRVLLALTLLALCRLVDARALLRQLGGLAP
jgi:hypothetical protein